MTQINYRAVERILQDVMAERREQLVRFGLEYHLKDGTGELAGFIDPIRRLVDKKMTALDHTWLHVLAEEVVEAAGEVEVDRLRAELVQVAAVTFAWIEAIDNRNGARFTCIMDVIKYAVLNCWEEDQAVAECKRLWPSVREIGSIREAFQEMRRQQIKGIARPGGPRETRRPGMQASGECSASAEAGGPVQ